MRNNTTISDPASGIRCRNCGYSGRILFFNLKDRQFHVDGKYALAKCSHCGLVWQHPLPKTEQLAGFYADYHTHTEVVEDSFWAGVFYRGIPVVTMGYEKCLASRSERFFGKLFSFLGPLRELGQGSIFWLNANSRGKLLDIGCGSGVFLRRWQNLGWDVHGVEMDPAAVRVARKTIQSDNVFWGTLDDLGSNEQYDVITLIHVIEHLLNPIVTLEKCRNLLKPGGALIISTPNAGGLGARILKKNWRGWEPPRHIYIYNPKTLSDIVQKAGFEVKILFTPSNATFLIWKTSLKEIWKRRRKHSLSHLVGLNIFILSFFFWSIEYILTHLGMECGEILHLVAVKNMQLKLEREL